MPVADARWHHRFALHTLAALLLTSVAHRVRLGAVLSTQAERMALSDSVPSLAAWQFAFADILVAAVLAGLAFGVARLVRGHRVARVALLITTTAGLLAVGLIRISHLGLLVAMQSGLTFRVLADALSSGDGVAVVQETPTMDLLWALPPAVVFWLSNALPKRLRWPNQLLAACTVAAALGMSILGASPEARPIAGLPDEAPWPPLGFTVIDTARTLLAEPPVDEVQIADDEGGSGSLNSAQAAAPPQVATEAPAAATTTTLSTAAAPTSSEVAAAARHSGRGLPHIGLRYTDPRLVDPTPVTLAKPKPNKRPVNIVWIIMESTGTRYAMGEVFKSRPPMPFLQELAASGWHLARHRSPSNSSATSIVAQMSGLLPLPSLRMMSVRKDNYLPGLPAFLPDWDRFLVTPGKLSYFFPRSFLQHNGMTDLWGYHELPSRKVVAKDRLAKDELETVDFFLKRLKRAKEPFLGVYYSYMPHWEYTDYGRKWRRYHGPRLIDHYHNGLWLLDHQLRRIVDGLKAKGVLDRTLVVLVGDHGEAFGQHKKNWAHAKGSWEENLQTPAILWAPGLLKPRTISWDTSHIDLLPTVLDLLGISYDPYLIQGESLLQSKLRRQVSFHWGNEATVTAIHVDGTKVQLSLTERWCRAYNLKKDPRERRRKRCLSPRSKELKALLRGWVHQQRLLLREYSESVRRGEPFKQRRHPTLKHVPTTP